MSFLTPLYIAGALFVALPILFHLIRRTPRDRVPFSSLMFLSESPPRVSRRSRLENLLLLALRAAALTLLALAFARPFFREPLLAAADSGDGRVIAVLVDTSASMRRADLWRQAAAHFDRVLAGTRPSDQIAVYAFDRDVRTIVSFAQWVEAPIAARLAFAKQQFESLSPTWGATHLGSALAAVADALDSHAGRISAAERVPEQRVILVGDLARGSDLTGLLQFEWPEQVAVEVLAVTARSHTNAGLQIVDDRADAPDAGATERRRVRVTNAADSASNRFRVQWSGGSGPPADVYVPAGKSRVVLAPAPPADSAPEELVLQGDDHDFDNAAFIVPHERQSVRLLFVGRGAANDPNFPRFYLDRAFPDSSWRSVRIDSHEPADRLSAADLAGVRFAVLADAVPDETVSLLRDFIEFGGTLLCVLTDVATAGSVGRLLDVADLPVEEARVREYAMLGEIDFSHPLFAPFSDPRFGDFTKIHFWKHRRVDLEAVRDARVIARFDDRAPALVEVPRGRGRLLLLTAGWHPADSQLAVSSKFVPLLGGMLDTSVGVADAPAALRVGDPAPLPDRGPGPLRIRLPDGDERTLPPGARQFTETNQPGIYSIVGSTPPVRFAVNLDPAESDTAPLPTEELEQLGVRLSGEKNSSKISADISLQRQLHAFDLESRQKLWRWLVVGLLAVLLAETWLAGRSTVRQP